MGCIVGDVVASEMCSGETEAWTVKLWCVALLAEILNCDRTAAVLQYHDVVPYMLEQSADGMLLAAETNQQAWAHLLDDAFWDRACPRRLVGGRPLSER